MTEASQPSVLSGAHPNLPRSQGIPRLPTASLYPPDRLTASADFTLEYQEWQYNPPCLQPPQFLVFLLRMLMFPFRFEYRRNMQEILPDVFLGPLQIARSNSILRSNRISLLIPVRTQGTARFLQVPKDENGKVWHAFPVDIQHDQIMGWFYKTHLIVKKEVEQGGRVLVYCESGNGLSAALCVALVMDTRLYVQFSLSGVS
jgi:hypothetical protein